MTTAIEKLSIRFESVVDELAALCNVLSIRNNSGDGFYMLVPNHYFGDRDAGQKLQHLGLVRRYTGISELLGVLTVGAPDDLAKDLVDGRNAFELWLQLGSNWSVSPDKAQNEQGMRAAADGLRGVIAALGAGPKDDLFLVPDTNALLACADPTKYRDVCAEPRFEFLLLPTVLGELDELKIAHRNPDVREKAQKVIARIKGWRMQGGLLEGVVVDKTIKIRALHSEPDMRTTLPWLQADSADDRILASVLSIQAASPSARVILVTGDINLQNKADAALVEVAEAPSP